MKSVEGEGRSPYASPFRRGRLVKNGEWRSVSVSVKAITGDPYGWPRHNYWVELRIGRGKRARIARLKPEAADRLARGLLDGARRVELHEAREEAWDKGYERACRERDQEERRGRKNKPGAKARARRGWSAHASRRRGRS